MKNFKKLLSSAMVAYLLMGNKSYAADLASVIESVGTGATKIVILIVAVLLLAAILFISYKSDSPTEIKPKVKKADAPKKGKKSKEDAAAEESAGEEKKELKEELVDENTYEVEENEVYVEDAIEPVKIADDEDEVSLFDSVNDNEPTVEESKTEIVFDDEMENSNNVAVEEDDDDFDFLNSYDEPEETVSAPTTASVETEGVSLDIDILSGSDSDDDYFDDAEEETPVSDGTMVFSADDLNANLKTNIFAENEDDEEVEVESVEENKEEFDYNYDYDFDFEDESKEEKVEEVEEVEEPAEANDDNYFDELENTENNEFKKEDDVFEDVEEEPTEFMGFTTIKSKAKKRGVSSWERTEYKLTERTESIESIRPSANKIKKDNSASDFLSQMAKNLGGEEKVAKKATAKKTEKKETTKKAAPKKTAAKTTTTKKTTKK